MNITMQLDEQVLLFLNDPLQRVDTAVYPSPNKLLLS